MSSIIIDLQNEITSSDCDVVNILRRAHIIAVKLGLKEFDQWISCELNGYHKQDVCPDYRKVRGELKGFNPYRGWIPTLIPNTELEKAICETRIPNSISEIINLGNTSENGFIVQITGEELNLLNHMLDSSSPKKFKLYISRSSVIDIVEKVKNAILEWTLKLENEGILGEGMRFSDEEKQTAKALPQTINNYYGATNFINAPSESIQIVSGNKCVTFSYDNANTAVSEIENAIAQDQIKTEDKDIALEILSEIKEKIFQEKEPNIIKALLVGLKDFLINSGGSLAAGLIQSKIQGLF